jgi:hypothetical protein
MQGRLHRKDAKTRYHPTLISLCAVSGAPGGFYLAFFPRVPLGKKPFFLHPSGVSRFVGVATLYRKKGSAATIPERYQWLCGHARGSDWKQRGLWRHPVRGHQEYVRR